MTEAPQNNGNGNGPEGNSGGATPPATPPAGNEPAFDPAKLSQDQLNQILEKNPEIWKTGRLAELRDKAKKFDSAETARQKAEQDALTEQGKFKELSEQQTKTIEELQGKIKDGSISSALVNKLVPLGVVDLDAAIKLIDRSNITIGDDGTIAGVDEAVETLKTEKAYLFSGKPGTPSVGNPTNPSNGGGNNEPPKFKASQFRGPEGAKFYQEHRDEILKAQAEGRIERD